MNDNVRLRPIAVVLVGISLLAACGAGEQAERPAGADPTVTTPTTAVSPRELPSRSAGQYPADQWTQRFPGGGCECADGSEYSYWTHDGDPSRVVLFFQGGGLCTDAVSCRLRQSTYASRASGYQVTGERSGIFDLTNPANPFRDWSFVYAPYCTGDLHLGDAVQDDGGGQVIHHRGAANASAALDHLIRTYPDVEHLVVMGSSAGAVPVPLYAARAADALPDADVAALADAAGAFPADTPSAQLRALHARWGSLDTLPDWPETEQLAAEGYTAPDLFVAAGHHQPRLRLARVDNAYDETLAEALPADTDELAVIVGNDRVVEDADVPLSSFVAAGTGHTVLGDDVLYTLTVDGRSFLDWLTALVDGESPSDVTCQACGPPAPPGG